MDNQEEPGDIKRIVDSAGKPKKPSKPGDKPAKPTGETRRAAADSKGTGGTQGTARAGAASSGSPEDSAEGTGGTKPGETVADDAGKPARPSYVVREDRSQFGPPGVWYHGHKSGGKDRDPEPVNVWLCSPLKVVAVTCTDGGRNFGRWLEFRDTFGHWQIWAMPMEMLRGSCEELRGELLAAGLHIDHRERARLADYLQWKTPQRRVTAALRTGWTRDGKAFVLPDKVIGSEDVIFQSETMHQDGMAETGGDFAIWKAEIAVLCVGNPVLVLSVCVSLAGPLLAKVQRDSGGVHWVNDSSTGKTTVLILGASAWGGETFRRTWRATANGLEGAAAALNDTCLCLDEINEADPKEIGSIIYALGNGTGKTRANRIGSARHVFRWRLALLSTGERTLSAQMAEGGKQPKAGQLVRLLNIPAARAFGVFDELHGFAEARALADHLKTTAGRHYGHAGPAFIDAMLREGGDFGAMLAAFEALPEFKADTSQEARVASRFALYALAGKLATVWGILPWPEGEALKVAAECYRLWREARGGGSTEDRQILEAVADFISRNGDGRFSRKSGDGEAQREDFILNRAGWWTDLEDAGRVYLFTSDGLKEATKGQDLPRVLAALDKAGWIHDRDRGEGNKRSKKTAVGKRRLSLYWILPGRHRGIIQPAKFPGFPLAKTRGNRRKPRKPWRFPEFPRFPPKYSKPASTAQTTGFQNAWQGHETQNGEVLILRLSGNLGNLSNCLNIGKTFPFFPVDIRIGLVCQFHKADGIGRGWNVRKKAKFGGGGEGVGCADGVGLSTVGRSAADIRGISDKVRSSGFFLPENYQNRVGVLPRKAGRPGACPRLAEMRRTWVEFAENPRNSESVDWRAGSVGQRPRRRPSPKPCQPTRRPGYALTRMQAFCRQAGKIAAFSTDTQESNGRPLPGND